VRAARRTAEDKPVAAIYVGGTEAGSRSSRSHTGALTGPEELYDGLFRQAGVLRADDIDDMIDMLWALSSQPLGGGKRVAVITNSGGPGTSLAYHAEKAGLAVPRFSTGLSSKLGRLTGPLAYVGNPVDLTFNTDVHVFKELLETVFDSGEVDGALLYGVFGAEDFMVNLKKRFPQLAEFAGQWDRHYRDFLGELAEVPRRYAKPLVVMSFLGSGSPAIDALVSGGVPVYPSARRAALALRSLLCRQEGGSSRGDGDGGLGGGGG
jgi:acetyltransferase